MFTKYFYVFLTSNSRYCSKIIENQISMQSFLALAQTRRSTRKFTSDRIPETVQKSLIQAALLSPASKRSNPWEFILIDNPQTLQELSKAKPHGGAFLAECPLAIVVIADTQKSDVWVEDTSIASIYIQLAAEDLGLGSCWVQIRKRQHESGEMASDYIKKLLAIPQQYEVESIIAVGYKAEERKPADLEKLLYERIHTNTFNP